MNIDSAASDSYKSISSLSKGLYKDKGSKFLSFAYPVENEAAAKIIIDSLRKEYFDARHHCWAYRLGRLGEKWRANDDGEPSSTAGKPILGQILSNGLSDILIVVVRYFGGTLLGTSGLIQAYKEASADAIANAEIIEKIECSTYEVSFDFEQMNSVMKVLKELGLSPADQMFDNRCTMKVKVRLNKERQFNEMMNKISICQKV